MGAIENTVEDRLGQGGVGHGVVPVVNRELAGDQGRAELSAVLDDLQQITALLDRGGGEQEVIEHEQGDPLQLPQATGVATVGPADGKVLEEAGDAEVERAASPAPPRP